MPALAIAGDLPSRLGKYDLLMPLAAGGMARIYIGRTTGIGSFERHVVLKLILPERQNDATAVQMFLDEARLAAALNHQNVAQVFEVGQDAGIHYLAMEYVHGQDLRALLAKAGGQGTRLPLELALTVVAGAASGLHHAHERRGPDGVPLGIVHRDVSPSNIMIGYDGSVKLLDFGIAKAAQRSVETQSGIIKGKFAYMAPEQCRGREVDPRSDVFSLGIILYEVTTQHRCFRADSDFDTMHRIVTGDVVRPTRLVPNYPQALEAIVMKALAVEPAQRYQSAAALLEALESFSIQNRMGLSTNALGKFMREMFGEQVEPWLVPSARSSQLTPIRPSESTISNTSTPLPTPTTGVVGVDTWVPEAQAESARVEQRVEQRGDARADWSARQAAPIATSDARPSQPMMLPPPPPGPARSSAPMAAVTPEHDPAAAFVAPMLTPSPQPSSPPFQTPVSGSGQGYVANQSQPGATAIPRTDPSYAQLELEGGTPILRSRMPIVVGACAVVAVAIIIVIAIAMTGKHPEVAAGPAPSATEPDTRAPAIAAPLPTPTPTPAPTVTPIPAPVPVPTPIEEPTITPKPTPAPVPEIAMIKLAVSSEPSSADVQLDGKYLGTTPLVVKRKPTTVSGVVVLHKKGYQDATLKIDLSSDVARSVSLKKLEPERAPVAVVRTPPPVRVPRKPACQPPAQVDPFDSRPVCPK